MLPSMSELQKKVEERNAKPPQALNDPKKVSFCDCISTILIMLYKMRILIYFCRFILYQLEEKKLSPYLI